MQTEAKMKTIEQIRQKRNELWKIFVQDDLEQNKEKKLCVADKSKLNGQLDILFWMENL
jgi:hypothetical protein